MGLSVRRLACPGMSVRWLACLLLAACASPSDDALPSDAAPPPAPEGPPFAMSFARSGSLYDAPFPSDDLRLPDGHVDVAKVPNPDGVDVIARSLALIARDARGFARTGAVYLHAGAPLDPASLPDLAATVTPDAPVLLVAVDPASPDFLRPRPADVAFLPDGGPFGDANLLAVLPLQGVPLRPATRYAAVVTRRVRYADGSVPPAWAPAGAPAGYREAVEALAPLVGAEDIAALAVFTTDDRGADLFRWVDDARGRGLPEATAPTLAETFDGYCVFQATVDMPVYQSGTPPYTRDGGDWGERPRVDHTETARLWITVPRAPVPDAGVPTVVFIGTGGGGERPLVDRGVCATPTYTAPITPGSGPAQEFARVGWAGVQIDGTLEGPRNPTGANEDLLIFNVFNPAALRDNIRQSALEIALLPDALSDLAFDASPCPGASGTFRIDAAHLALMGHSMGASIAPLALAAQSAYQTALLSGAGASFIANVVDKQKPVAVRPVAEALLHYAVRGRTLTPHDPALTFFQWATEPADAQIYGPLSRNILMMQGIVDHYILPNIANGTSLAFGLDLAGPALDDTPELRALGQRSIRDLLPLVGHDALPQPVAGNAGGHTAVVVQNRGDDVEDGHETDFQTERPKAQYRCFLADVAAGRVPAVRDDCGR